MRSMGKMFHADLGSPWKRYIPNTRSVAYIDCKGMLLMNPECVMPLSGWCSARTNRPPPAFAGSPDLTIPINVVRTPSKPERKLFDHAKREFGILCIAESYGVVTPNWEELLDLLPDPSRTSVTH